MQQPNRWAYGEVLWAPGVAIQEAPKANERGAGCPLFLPPLVCSVVQKFESCRKEEAHFSCAWKDSRACEMQMLSF